MLVYVKLSRDWGGDWVQKGCQAEPIEDLQVNKKEFQNDAYTTLKHHGRAKKLGSPT